MIKIIADSTCDLGKELIKKYGVDIIPLHVHLDDKEYRDGVDISQEELFKWAEEAGKLPKTSAVSLSDTIDKFEEYLEKGYEIICFGISSKMSSTVQIMNLAVEELEAEDKICVIDSENIATGIGLLIIEAASMITDGKSLKEIEETINLLKKNIRTNFVVDTLEYLHKGGRCSGMAAIVGGAIKLHPTIVCEDGSLVAKKKYRGKMTAVVNSMFKDLKDELLKADKKRVFITHCCEDLVVDKIYNSIKELDYFDEILITNTGSVVSSHCGPGTCAIIFIGK